MNDLIKQLIELSKLEVTEEHLTFITDGQLVTHGVGKTQLATQVFQLLTMFGIGKDRRPMTIYDPDMQVLLNKRGYFSFSLGNTYSSQSEDVEKNLLNKNVRHGVYVFSSKYNLLRHDIPAPGLWNMGITIYDDHVSAVVYFGNATLAPRVHYDVVGAMTILEKTLQTIKASDLPRTVSWHFQSIKSTGVCELQEVDLITSIPDDFVLGEFLRVEELIRNNQPKVIPPAQVPFDDGLFSLLESIVQFHRNNNSGG